jgi:protein SCO1
MSSRNVIWGLIATCILAMIALVVVELSDRSRSVIPEYTAVPDFQLIERSGAIFSKQNMLGKISIINFFFSSCQGPCPAMNARVAELYGKYVTTDKVQFVSITVDPDRDSLQVLERYASRLGVHDHRWLFLRGSVEDVQHLSEQGFKMAADGLPALHSTRLVLVDAAGMIRGYYNSLDEASLQFLTVHVRELLKGR